MQKVYLHKNPKTGQITEHSSPALRSDPVSNVLLEYVGEKEVEVQPEPVVEEKKNPEAMVMKKKLKLKK